MVLGPASAPRAEDPAPGKLYLASDQVKGSRQGPGSRDRHLKHVQLCRALARCAMRCE